MHVLVEEECNGHTLAAACILGGTIGYWVGVGRSLPLTRSSNDNSSLAVEDDQGSESGSDDEDDAKVAQADLGAIKAGMMEECKLVLVVNDSLKMTKGKIAAQCSHATLACYKTLQVQNPAILNHWERTGQAKIALRVESTEGLLSLQEAALKLNLCARTIQDAGRTEVAAGSRTVVGIGPAPVRLINQVTGKLKLL